MTTIAGIISLVWALLYAATVGRAVERKDRNELIGALTVTALIAALAVTLLLSGSV